MKLSIIIPVYNEGPTIKSIVEYVQAVNYPIEHEVIIIDDASVDRTYEKAFILKIRDKIEHRQIRIFRNEVNKGKTFSIRKGIKMATGDIIIIQDADKEYNPSEIPQLINPIIKGEAKVVYGSRFLKKRHPNGMAFPNWVANKILTKLANILFGLKITDEATCYKVFKTDLLKSFNLRTNRFGFCPEVTALLGKKKIKIIEIPITYHARSTNEGKKIRVIDFVFAVMVLFWQRLIK